MKMTTTTRSRAAAAIGALLAWAAIVLLAAPVASAAIGSWSAAGNLSVARSEARATTLPGGHVLVAGGFSDAYDYNTRAVELYDPDTNSWSLTGSLAYGHAEGVLVGFGDGTVWMTGGVAANICAYDTRVEIYDPAYGWWFYNGGTGTVVARSGATATLMNDGRTLLVGGGNRCGAVYASAEVPGPSANGWVLTGSMAQAREWAKSVLLADGRVLVVGGTSPSPFAALASAEIYDPATGQFTPTGSMATTRSSPTLVRLADGRVMAAGGYSGAVFGGGQYPNGGQVEIFDPATGLWSVTDSLMSGRSGGTLSLLDNGMVLAAGGYDGATTSYVATAEVWDPATGNWSPATPMAHARSGHTATVLADGSVLVAGGMGSAGRLTSAELFSLDVTPPDITITTPEADGTYLLGASVLADYSCTDDAGTPTCEGPVASGAAIDTSTAGSHSFTVDSTDAFGNTATETHTYTVVYEFTGFFRPVNNPPSLNKAKAGSQVQVKFALAGYQGMSVLASGSPFSTPISCTTGSPTGSSAPTSPAGASGLRYSSTTLQYTYSWKTNKLWAGTCRQLTVELADGTTHPANFRFT